MSSIKKDKCDYDSYRYSEELRTHSQHDYLRVIVFKVVAAVKADFVVIQWNKVTSNKINSKQKGSYFDISSGKCWHAAR